MLAAGDESSWLEANLATLERLFGEAVDFCYKQAGDGTVSGEARICALLAKHFTAKASASSTQQCEGQTDDDITVEWGCERFIASLPLSVDMAAALLAERPDATTELDFCKQLDETTVTRLLASGSLRSRVTQRVAEGLATLRVAAAATGGELNAKFLQMGANEVSYAPMALFTQGLEVAIGPPKRPADLDGQVHDEHCASADTDAEFQGNNYSIRTTPRIEYWFVVDPERGMREVRSRTAR